MLDFVDEALDAVPEAIGVFIVGEFDTARAQGRDHDINLGVGETGTEAIVVVALVGDQADQCEALDQCQSLRGFVDLSCGEHEAERIAECIDGDMDLGAQATTRAADRLIECPPFAPAAC